MPLQYNATCKNSTKATMLTKIPPSCTSFAKIPTKFSNHFQTSNKCSSITDKDSITLAIISTNVVPVTKIAKIPTNVVKSCSPGSVGVRKLCKMN